jgi:hypothetical protein
MVMVALRGLVMAVTLLYIDLGLIYSLSIIRTGHVEELGRWGSRGKEDGLGRI